MTTKKNLTSPIYNLQVCEGYKYNVLAYFPNLLYLDGTEILTQDRPLRNDLFIRHLSTKATFYFYCYRIVGLPPPPKSVILFQ